MCIDQLIDEEFVNCVTMLAIESIHNYLMHYSLVRIIIQTLVGVKLSIGLEFPPRWLVVEARQALGMPTTKRLNNLRDRHIESEEHVK